MNESFHENVERKLFSSLSIKSVYIVEECAIYKLFTNVIDYVHKSIAIWWL